MLSVTLVSGCLRSLMIAATLLRAGLDLALAESPVSSIARQAWVLYGCRRREHKSFAWQQRLELRHGQDERGPETRRDFGRTERLVFRRDPKIRELRLLFPVAIADKCLETETGHLIHTSHL